ncbi:MAG: hypothetical protein ABIE36_01050 [Candidatus Diapherotrites archaeon]
MLNSEIIKKIEDFVYTKPRSIQEISEYIKKNWRTVDRYINEIKENFGTIDTRTFREGTRGALKLVYWSSRERVSSSSIQKVLEKEIYEGKTKYDFSPFDIFQNIKDQNKNAVVGYEEKKYWINDVVENIKNTKKQLLLFSGNLSLINFKEVFEAIEEIVKKDINIKIISRVDLAGKENIEKMLSLNFKYGKELIEIRHKEQPVRGFISDGKIIKIKEVKDPTNKENELKTEAVIFYTLKDKEWAEWLSKIFWKMFSSSIDANKRIDELSKLTTYTKIQKQ